MNVRLKMNQHDDLEIHQEEIWIAPRFDIMGALAKLIRKEQDTIRVEKFKTAIREGKGK